jgi:hypothetical protein
VGFVEREQHPARRGRDRLDLAARLGDPIDRHPGRRRLAEVDVRGVDLHHVGGDGRDDLRGPAGEGDAAHAPLGVAEVDVGRVEHDGRDPPRVDVGDHLRLPVGEAEAQDGVRIAVGADAGRGDVAPVEVAVLHTEGAGAGHPLVEQGRRAGRHGCRAARRRRHGEVVEGGAARARSGPTRARAARGVAPGRRRVDRAAPAGGDQGGGEADRRERSRERHDAASWRRRPSPARFPGPSRDRRFHRHCQQRPCAESTPGVSHRLRWPSASRPRPTAVADTARERAARVQRSPASPSPSSPSWPEDALRNPWSSANRCRGSRPSLAPGATSRSAGGVRAEVALGEAGAGGDVQAALRSTGPFAPIVAGERSDAAPRVFLAGAGAPADQ